MPAVTERTARPLSAITADVARDCLKSLETPAALADEKTIHDLRVASKRLRAAWHLVADLSGRGQARKQRSALRGLSAHLSGTRDRTVLLNLTAELATAQADDERADDERAADALARAGNALRELPPAAASIPPGTDTLASIRACLTDEVAAWHALDQRGAATWRRAIRHQLRRAASHARHAAAEALRDTDAERWHAWRKRVKRLRYQREFIAASQDRQQGLRLARLSRLGTLLGERNDLVNLAARVDALAAANQLDRRDHGLVRKVIAAKERTLISRCRRLGRRV